jgi:hypothetical protein
VDVGTVSIPFVYRLCIVVAVGVSAVTAATTTTTTTVDDDDVELFVLFSFFL